MALYSTTTAPHGLSGLRIRIQDGLARRRVYRTTLSELSVLSDRELSDLGISRSMIKGIAAEAAYSR